MPVNSLINLRADVVQPGLNGAAFFVIARWDVPSELGWSLNYALDGVEPWIRLNLAGGQTSFEIHGNFLVNAFYALEMTDQLGGIARSTGFSLFPGNEPPDIIDPPQNLTRQIPAASETPYGIFVNWDGRSNQDWQIIIGLNPDTVNPDSPDGWDPLLIYNVVYQEFYAVPPDLEPDVQYYWGIRSFDAAGNNVWTEGEPFLVPFGTEQNPLPPLEGDFPVNPDEFTLGPVIEPEDLRENSDVNIGEKLRTMAQHIRDVRARIRSWNE